MIKPTFELSLKTEGKAITNDIREIYNVIRNKQDAEFIVHTCNSYEKLINKLIEIKQVIDERIKLSSNSFTESGYLAIKDSINIDKLLKELNEL